MDRDKEYISIEKISTHIKVTTQYFDNVIFFLIFTLFQDFTMLI